MNTTKISQLTLGVSLKDDATFANYFVGDNAQVVDALKKSAQGFGERVIYFYGNGGEGCTHLLQACCHAATEQGRRAVYISLENSSEISPEIFEGLESLDLVCIDDVHRMVGKKIWEEALFHAYNRLQIAGSHLIVAANHTPKGLNLQLPDLESRLSSGVVFALHALSDAEKMSVLMMRAERRGLVLSEDVAKFLLTHCPRHLSTLFAALSVLDKASLATQRKLTIPFVKNILAI